MKYVTKRVSLALLFLCHSCRAKSVSTKAVLLFASRLAVDHQVRHLHSNLGLFLNFLLLPDLKLDRKKKHPLPAYTRWEIKQKKPQPAHICVWLLYVTCTQKCLYIKWLSRLASCSLLYCWLMARWVMSQATLYHSKSSSKVPAARSNCRPSSSLSCSCNTWGFPFLPFFTINKHRRKSVILMSDSVRHWLHSLF